MSTAVFLCAEIDALPGRDREIAELLTGYAARVRSEPGNRGFEAFRQAEHPDRFFIYEHYESDEAFEAHKGADYCARFNAELAPLAVGGGSRLTMLDPIP